MASQRRQHKEITREIFLDTFGHVLNTTTVLWLKISTLNAWGRLYTEHARFHGVEVELD